jgi:fumarate reductase subunit C
MAERYPKLHRPHDGLWWARKHNYFIYVLRELSSVFVALTALGTVFVVHQIRLGEGAWQATKKVAASDAVGVLVVVALVFALLHTVTFIVAARKALIVRIGGKRVSGDAIVWGHIAGWALGTALVTWAVLG